ncbi:hypothetical protein YC2023_115338 [Brassica napus]
MRNAGTDLGGVVSLLAPPGFILLPSLSFCRNAHPSFFPFHFMFGSYWWVFVKDVLGSLRHIVSALWLETSVMISPTISAMLGRGVTESLS